MIVRIKGNKINTSSVAIVYVSNNRIDYYNYWCLNILHGHNYIHTTFILFNNKLFCYFWYYFLHLLK